MRELTDDLGYAVRLPERVTRVVSLVPSLTEAVAASAPGVLVGATDFCTHPGDLDVARVRGTKNPDVAAVAALAPDLVIANKEENRELDVRRLRERGVAVWVTDIETVTGAVASMRRLLVEAGGWRDQPWLDEVERRWLVPVDALPSTPGARAAVAVWRDPWMLVGRPTFTADVLSRLGVDVWSGPGRGVTRRWSCVSWTGRAPRAARTSCCCPTSRMSSPRATGRRRSPPSPPGWSVDVCSRGTGHRS